MKKSILNLNGAKELTKNEQKKLNWFYRRTEKTKPKRPKWPDHRKNQTEMTEPLDHRNRSRKDRIQTVMLITK